MRLNEIVTPVLLLDAEKMHGNIARMNAAVRRHPDVTLRPHMKTGKSVEIARAMTDGWPGAVTVSTLKEAERFFDAGYRDILYAVGITPAKLPHVAALTARGATLTTILDSVAAAKAVAGFGRAEGVRLPVLIEIDTDGQRAGVRPHDGASLREIAGALQDGADLRGVMTHCGGSYGAASPLELPGYAETERAGAVEAADCLRAAGYAAPVVSVGSTPMALFAEQLDGVTEVRAGVHVFHDLVMAGLGVCTVEDIALSVLATVIGHRPDQGELVIDAGWTALSRDKGRGDQGYGLVAGSEDLVVRAVNQEHGIVADRHGRPIDLSRWPIGGTVRVLPNHACATAAQHDRYHVAAGGEVVAEWPRFGGWR